MCIYICLFYSLICDADDRLGRSGIDDFKAHPFFRGVDWDSLRTQTPPYIPEFTSEADTRNFEPYEPEDDGGGRHVRSIMKYMYASTCIHVHSISLPMYVRVCVCMYMYVYACMYACMYIHCMYVCITCSCILQDNTPPLNMSALTFHLPFVGFTYTNSSILGDNPPKVPQPTRDNETGIIHQPEMGSYTHMEPCLILIVWVYVCV